MSTTFPTSLQDLDATRGSTGQTLSNPNHITHHRTEDDTIEALQAKVGVDNSAVTTSLDYLVKSTSSTDPGHKHTISSITGYGFPTSDGSDGDVTISGGTTTLTRDMFYNSLTVNSSGTLQTAGYRIFVQETLTVDASSGASIRNNGSNGSNGSNSSGGTGGAGGSGGAGGTGGSLPAGTNGSAGGAGASDPGGSGTAGTAGTNTTHTINTSAGVAGGTGGTAGTPGAGGAGGTVGATTNIPRNIVGAYSLFDFTSSTAVTQLTVNGGAGGGGGGAVNASTGAAAGGGGGGGGGGGIVWFLCKTLSITGTAAIQAKGGNGGNGGNAGGSFGGGGGGAGGAGGVIIAIYNSKTGTGTMVTTGGTGGSAGTGGSPAASAGTTGNSGSVIEITV